MTAGVYERLLARAEDFQGIERLSPVRLGDGADIDTTCAFCGKGKRGKNKCKCEIGRSRTRRAEIMDIEQESLQAEEQLQIRYAEELEQKHM